ncbi:MAG: CpaF family protein [Chloroflexi bacterium]|nr:CpaF family protein [Chloroflexota bacterium]MCL5110936.1 CpaF family protein [Chloroflexota bacterium]
MSLLRRIEGNLAAPAATPAASPESTRATSTTTGSRDSGREMSLELRAKVQNRLISELDPKMDLSDRAKVERTIEELFNLILAEENIILTRVERSRFFEQILAEILGYGPIENLLKDETISEVMINGPRQVYIERKGRIVKTDTRFENDAHVMRIIDRIISPLGRRCDETQPMVDARLPDGSRVNAVIPPISLVGPVVTIRKFAKNPLTVDQLIEFGSITREVAEFLRACVIGRLNIIISGGTGSGKTTLLNVLSDYIPDDERIVTVEDAAELQLRQEHTITLEARPANIEGKGQITIRDLAINALRMRPDRIVVGECRGREALDMLQAMNTGHDGSLTTLHSNSPRDTIARLETMVLMAGMDLPLRAIREQIAAAIDLVVHQERFRDGTRRVTSVTEVQGLESETIVLQDIFTFQQTGVSEGRVLGQLRPTGMRPKFAPKLERSGINLPPSIFGIRLEALR